MQPDPRAYLWDALRAIDRIGTFTRGRTAADYRADELVQSAVERQFEILGEAVNQMSKVDRALGDRVPRRREIIGFRNILIHGYATVDVELVWQSVQELPDLRPVLQSLLDELDR